MPADSKEQILLTIVRFYPEIEALRQRYPEILRATVPEYGLGRLAVLAVAPTQRIEAIMRGFLAIQCINRVIVVNDDVDIESAEDVLWAVSNRTLDPAKVLTEPCVDEWWNHLKLGIDTTVDTDDIRHKRPRIVRVPLEGWS
jgi:UbiD family decarboxylase